MFGEVAKSISVMEFGRGVHSAGGVQIAHCYGLVQKHGKNISRSNLGGKLPNILANVLLGYFS